jgi:hypothetical protein
MKYDQIGGIEYVIKSFENGVYGVVDISSKIGFSHETVRQDFINKIGKEKYSDAVLNRQKLKKGIFLNTSQAITFLDATNKSHRYLKEIVTIISINLKGVHDLRFYKLNQISFSLKNNKNVILRYSVVKKGMADYPTRNFRFNIHQNIEKFDYAIFVIFHSHGTHFYIFRTDNISYLRTLALKYKAEKTRNKYLYALDKWAILNSEESTASHNKYLK